VPVAEPSEAALGNPPARIVYLLERIDIVGNWTSADVIRSFLPIEPGELLDVDDPDIDRVRFRLLGTGWFNDVRLHLKRGSQRGRVVLVVEVEERNTLVISRVVAGLARVVTNTSSGRDPLRPYAGIGLTETNLLGLGIGVGASLVVSEHQAGVDFRYNDPVRLGARLDLRGRFFYNDAREFFGRDPLVTGDVHCTPPQGLLEGDSNCDLDVRTKRAVVIYERGGIGLGTGRDLTSHLRYEIDWLGEIVDVSSKPTAASTLRGKHGEEWRPIDFHIEPASSYVSSLQLALIFDTRDDPALPSRGQMLRMESRFASGLIGSTYDFVRLEVAFRNYFRLPWGHVLSPGVFVGTVFGDAPFFYQFYAADLSDLVPSRVLELNLDHRRTHNLLDTSIQEFDKEELAARIDVEYQLPLARGGGNVRGIDAYAGFGVFLLAERHALKVGLPGYEGAERIPIDLTFDIGVQADTSIGQFKVGFSSLIGFWPDLGQSQ
jgi:outer membrane protein assembly factor BamA